ncbi:MAG: hypothetical protein M0R77_00935 [Gammaproteobacteria bacterium]|nr:hypothetical protein [Acholeplasmataceae bacterium]MCK9529120.1 hypothetical protein [Gammaproteobacteria bacterium]
MTETVLDLTTPTELEPLMIQQHLSLADRADVRVMLEYHMPFFLLPDNGARTVEIEAGESIRYEGDFYGLMRFMNESPDHDWVNLRMNHLNNPVDFLGTETTIYLIGKEYYGSVLSQIKTLLQKQVKK